MQVSRSITVCRDRGEVYRGWRDFERLPAFMQHVRSVVEQGDGRSHWVVDAPAGQTVEWDAEILDDRPGERLSWRTVGDSTVKAGGVVNFRDAPADRGTEIDVTLDYHTAAGPLGAVIAKLFGEEPSQQLADDLRRFKQIMEAGEIVRSDGSPDGAGQGTSKQRAAQPAGAEVRS